jgi:transposase
VDAIRCLVEEGIRWRAMPADLPHWRTVYDVADGWHNSGAAGKKHDELRRQCRIAAGRRSEPAAAVIGSQPVKAAEEVSGASCGYDAGKKVNSRKRHIAVDTIGLLLTVLITAAEARIATEQSRYCGTCAVPFPRGSWPGLTAATPANSSPGPRPRSSLG